MDTPLGLLPTNSPATFRYAALRRKLYRCATEISARRANFRFPNSADARFRIRRVAGPLSRSCARSTSASSATCARVYLVGNRRRRYGFAATTPVLIYERIRRAICGRLRPVTLLKYARIAPFVFLACRPYSGATSVFGTQAYTSARVWPANSIASLAFKNSPICEWVRLSAFRIPHSDLHSPAACLSSTSHFQDHLALETSPVSGSSCIGQFSGRNPTARHATIALYAHHRRPAPSSPSPRLHATGGVLIRNQTE